MSGFDQGQVFSANLDLKDDTPVAAGTGTEVNQSTKTEAQSKFRQFLLSHQEVKRGSFHYRDQLNDNYVQGTFMLTVDAGDITSFDTALMKLLRENPGEFIPVFEKAAADVISRLAVPRIKPEDVHPIQINLVNYDCRTDMRHLNATHVQQLVTVSGIVVSASKTNVKATELTIMCRNCRALKKIKVGAGFGGARMPRTCDTTPMQDQDMAKCPLDPFRILPDSSKYVDIQQIKLQERPEDVPTGEMPRHVAASMDRYLVASVKPGQRVTVVGIYSTYEKQDNAGRDRSGVRDIGVRRPYLRVLSVVQEDTDASKSTSFDPEEEEEIIAMSRTDNIYEKMSGSIAPAIFGHEDIKRAICCMLFGGSRKHLPDGMRLRGDINVLLLGDPSVGKSQFLKFAIQAAPIGVYTSGKGSSAAGLTASVIRDPGSGEFHLEGGALVLADGGLVCIDEFDKMREQDRVAIHEAMEQQTISIAKAGITTILNSRASVLAAANPVFSRYDDMKSATENIDFQTTILSRFDLIFIVRDVINMQSDMKLALHIINVHKMKNSTGATTDAEGLIDIQRLKKYIAYARANCNPRLSEAAAKLLNDRYVTFRSEANDYKRKNAEGSAIPITVRQLEAVIRLSESLARMELKNEANGVHVAEAIRLFKVSTFQAATSDSREVVGTVPFNNAVKSAVAYLERRVAIGAKENVSNLVAQLIQHKHHENAARAAIDMLVGRGTFEYSRQRRLVMRRI